MKRRRNSIFIRLLAIMLFTAVFVSILIFSLTASFLRGHDVPALGHLLRGYTRYIFNDLDKEPTLAHAREMAKRLSIDIRYKDGQTSWATDPNMPTFEEITGNTKDNAGIYKDSHFLLRKRDNRFYLLYGNLLPPPPRLPQGFYFIVLLMGLIFIASYFFIRTIINPVKELQKAVEQVKTGNLSIKIPVKRMDELGELSVQFNAMADQIKQMFKLKDQLLLDVSHELRSPLTRMKVALEFIKQDKIKRTLTEEVDGMESMIQEILETARLDSPHGKLLLENIRLFSFLKNVVQEMSSRKPGLELKPRRDNLVIRADSRRLSIMFGNIIDNALRYSKHQKLPVVLRITHLKEGVKVSIRDSGCGIPAQNLPFIFEPFYRVDPSRSKETGGYGIGFFLSKRIAEAHGAKIRIRSSEGKGTEVTVIFPPALMGA